jgi:hypothetical protein
LEYYRFLVTKLPSVWFLTEVPMKLKFLISVSLYLYLDLKDFSVTASFFSYDRLRVTFLFVAKSVLLISVDKI